MSGKVQLYMNESSVLQTSKLTQEILVERVPFIGRQEEIRLIMKLLQENNLITLVGPGGIGKTRLAIKTAQQYASHFQQDVLYAPLTNVSVDDSLGNAIIELLHLPIYGAEDPYWQLINYLQEKKLLLILDNFENLMPKSEVLTDILKRAPQVKLLITSQERLNLYEEVVFEVKGLSFPKSDVFDDPTEFESMQLFLQCARRIRTSYSVTSDNQKHVACICRLVNGLPLAIELAAAWVRVLSCEEIAQEIERNLNILTAHWQNIPNRHNSIRATFSYSWELLSTEERDVVKRLSVFRGGFSLQAAREVTGASLTTLFSLVDKSFLQRITADWYNMLTLLRQFAYEKLEQSLINCNETREAHCCYFMDLLRVHLWNNQGELQKLSVLHNNIGNIRSAWWWAVEQRRYELIDYSLDNLFLFCEARSIFHEGKNMFLTADQLLNTTEDNSRYHQQIRQKLLSRYGAFCQYLGQYEMAHHHLKSGLRQAKELGDHNEIIFCFLYLAHTLVKQGKYQEAQEQCAAGLSACEKSGEISRLVMLLNEMGHINTMLGKFDEARLCLTQALAKAEQTKLRRQEGMSLTKLGNLYWRQNHIHEANEHYAQALPVFEKIGDKRSIGILLNNLGLIQWNLGNYSEAQSYLEKSQQILREIGDRQAESLPLINLGNLAADQQTHSEAQRYYEEALHIKQAINDKHGQALALVGLGNVAWSIGEYSTDYFQKALVIFRDIGDRQGEAGALVNLGLVASRLGKYVQAKELYELALALFVDVNNQYGECVVLSNLSLLATCRQNYHLAYEQSQAALHLATQLTNPHLQGYALTNMGHALVGLGKVLVAIPIYERAIATRQDLGEQLLMLEATAGLARVFAIQKEWPKSLHLVEKILPYLERAVALNGTDEPAWIYLTCYCVLKANNDCRADEILARAFTCLQNQASHILDNQSRQYFLEGAVFNHEICKIFTKINTPTTETGLAPGSTPEETLLEPLTAREKEVLNLMADGMSNMQIAEFLFISVATVKRHAYNIYQKLTVNTRMQAVAKAQKLNLLSSIVPIIFLKLLFSIELTI